MESEADLIVALSSKDSLDRSPKKNWVEENGGLPPYIHKIAAALHKSGKPISSAISIAISRTKAWAAGGDDVDADTKAKAIKAVAQWEALKAKAKGSQVVKASRQDGSEYISLSVGSFNTDDVRKAWNAIEETYRSAKRLTMRAAGLDEYSGELSYSYIRELWTDYIIIEREGGGRGTSLAKVPYGVTADGDIYFGEPLAVEQTYVEVDDRLNQFELSQLSDVMLPASAEEIQGSEIERLVALSRG